MNITESPSKFNDLEKMPVRDLLVNINNEDKTVAIAVEKAIPEIENLVNGIVERMKQGGRLFYIGAGTSGRLGVVDASELPPTFGVSHGIAIGLIAGGDAAIRRAVEFAEDDREQAWQDLKEYNINKLDTVVGIAASGRTPYVIGGLASSRTNGIYTGSIACNAGSEISKHADVAIEVVVGPEFVTGSTRMKAGTAQKLVLNMLSTSVMIQLGRIKGNKMVDMQLTNNKLVDRGTKMIMDELNIGAIEAEELLKKYGNVRTALESYKHARH